MLEVITDNLDVWTTAQKQKKAVGRGRAKKDESYGIKKLRELILELAVRGKLVQQDSNDEPASVLLEKIEEKKQRLIKEGKIKKQKSLPEFSEKASLSAPPNNWVWSRLGDISFINPRNIAEDETIASFVPMPLVLKSHTGEHGQEHRVWGDIKKGYTHFANNDIGLAKITPCFENSKTVVFSNLKNGIGAGTTELHIARPYGATLNSRYVLLYLKSPDFLLTGESKMTGTAGQKRVPKTFFTENPLPLPPLAEQHRIVAKVDELMALCDQLEQEQADHQSTHQTLVETLLNGLVESAKSQAKSEANNQQSTADYFNQLITEHFDTLFTTEQSIDQLKQTILQLAVMGKLVPQDPKNEPASVLLEKIAEEKAKLIEEGKIKKQKVLPEIEEDEKLHGIPNKWEWVRFGNILNLLSDYHANGSYEILKKNVQLLDNEDYAIMLRTTNFSEINRKNYKYITEHAYNFLAKSKVFEDDIIMNKIGDPGASFLVDNRGMKMSLAMNLFLLRTSSLIDSEYAFLYLLANYKYIKSFAGGTSTQTITKDAVNNLAFPLSPYDEQEKIVTKANQLLTLCDTLKANLNQAQTTQTQLADAIVKQAVS